MTTINSDQREAADTKAWRTNWLFAVVWLAFLLFPLASLWSDDDIGTAGRIGATAALGAFAVVYVLAFRIIIRRLYVAPDPEASTQLARRTLVVLAALNGVAFAFGGWATLFAAPFLIAFAVVTLSWREAIGVVIVCHVVAIGIPVAMGIFDDLWPLTPPMTGITLAMVLMRLNDESVAERTDLQAELLLSDERNRVARDVHDVLGHSLTAVVLKAELTKRLLARVEPASDADQETIAQCQAELEELTALSRRSLAEIRSTVGGLRNPNLADEVAAARTVLADAGVTCTTTGDAAGVPERARSALAWVIREAVTNVVRHADADHCTVMLSPTPSVWLRIEDDGAGPGGLTEGNGLTGLRERLALVGAKLCIDARGSGGTRLEVQVV